MALENGGRGWSSFVSGLCEKGSFIQCHVHDTSKNSYSFMCGVKASDLKGVYLKERFWETKMIRDRGRARSGEMCLKVSELFSTEAYASHFTLSIFIWLLYLFTPQGFVRPAN